MSSKDSVSKISHCDAKEAFACDPPSTPPHLTTGSVKCTTAQLHISFDCQFVLCAARGFEPRLKMKANLVLSVSTVGRRCLFCCRRHQELGDFFFFFFFPLVFPMVLYHAGLSIMYNLSCDISPDSSPSRFHLNLMPFLSPLCLERGRRATPQRCVIVVSGGCTLHLAVSMVRALPLATHVSISILSSSFFPTFLQETEP